MNFTQIRKSISAESKAEFDKLVQKYQVRFPSQPKIEVAKAVAEMINSR